MTIKWIGAALVISGCCGCGFSLAGAYRRKEDMLYQMIRMVTYMEHQLQFKLTPLPELVRMASAEGKGSMRELFRVLAFEMENQILPDPQSCMAAALAKVDSMDPEVRLVCRDLGRSLGVFDLPGQLDSLQRVKERCEIVLKTLQCNRELRIRSYKTLSICAGVALVILFI